MTKQPEYARCNACKQIVEIVVARDYENCAEWVNSHHWGANGSGDPSGGCSANGFPDHSQITDEELAQHHAEGNP